MDRWMDGRSVGFFQFYLSLSLSLAPLNRKFHSISFSMLVSAFLPRTHQSNKNQNKVIYHNTVWVWVVKCSALHTYHWTKFTLFWIWTSEWESYDSNNNEKPPIRIIFNCMQQKVHSAYTAQLFVAVVVLIVTSWSWMNLYIRIECVEYSF